MMRNQIRLEIVPGVDDYILDLLENFDVPKSKRAAVIKLLLHELWMVKKGQNLAVPDCDKMSAKGHNLTQNDTNEPQMGTDEAVSNCAQNDTIGHGRTRNATDEPQTGTAQNDRATKGHGMTRKDTECHGMTQTGTTDESPKTAENSDIAPENFLELCKKIEIPDWGDVNL